VDELLRRLKADGHDPVLWEGFRTFARAEELQRRGSGIVKSMHCYGIAADIIDRFHRWNARPPFWAALGKHADDLGLEWGGTWQRVDRPHVQALPASLDHWVRSARPDQVAEKVSVHLDASDPARRKTLPERPSNKPTPIRSPMAAVDAPAPKDPRSSR
jgi:hypothetical protein